jgi:hypothetical protein
MADDEEYDEVEAVVRIPKGERLADSRKTEGWSRGFTPKSTDKGPKHAEIRVKAKGESQSVQGPEVIRGTEYVKPRPPVRSMAKQAAADVRDRAMDRVIDELAEAAARQTMKLIEAAGRQGGQLWNTHVSPAMSAKREDFRLWRQTCKAKKVRRANATATTLIAEQAAEDEASSQQVAIAPEDPKTHHDERAIPATLHDLARTGGCSTGALARHRERTHQGRRRGRPRMATGAQ